MSTSDDITALREMQAQHGERIAALEAHDTGFAAALLRHEQADDRRHTEALSTMRGMSKTYADSTRQLFRLLAVSMFVIFAALGLISALVGTSLYLDSTSIRIEAANANP